MATVTYGGAVRQPPTGGLELADSVAGPPLPSPMSRTWHPRLSEASDEDLSVIDDEEARRGAATSTARGSSDSPGPLRQDGDLPDLTSRLQAYGIYGEYLEYRRGYMKWRQGGATGAKGELTGQSRPTSRGSLEGQRLEKWYPSLGMFRWRYTTAYWMGVFSLEGACLFTVNAAFELTIGDEQMQWTKTGYRLMTTVPNLIGGVGFVLALYFSFLQLINMPTENSERIVLWKMRHWGHLLRQTRLDSVVGTLAYFAGSIIFFVGCVSPIMLPHDGAESVKLLLIGLPNFTGSLLFLLGGICEMTHNHVFSGGSTCSQPVWWAAVLNTVGGLNFCLGSAPAVLFSPSHSYAQHMWVAGNYFVGSFLFVVSSVLLLCMWRANDFGLTLISQLNRAVTARGRVRISVDGEAGAVGVQVSVAEDKENEENGVLRDVSRKSFSNRGVVFIVIYCWFVCVALLDCICKAMWYKHSTHQRGFRTVVDLATQVFLVMIIKLLLVIHSAVARVPREQPYKCAMISVRALFTIGAALETLLLVKWLVNPEYELTWPGDELLPPTSHPVAAHLTSLALSAK